MGFFSDLFHPGNAYKKAGQVAQDYYNQAQGYQQPYVDRGNAMGSDLANQYQQLMNPQDMQNKWAESYQTSPYAQQLQGEAQTKGLDAASAMGLGGSSAALGNIQQTSTGIMNQDRQQYMKDLMEKYMQGIGLGQNMYGTGANAAGQMGQNAMNQGQNMAQMKFGQTQAGPNMFGNVLGAGLGMAGNYLSGGLGVGSMGRGIFAPKWMQ